MQIESEALLHDIRQAAELVTQFIGSCAFAQYHHDSLLRSGVERQLAIIGEALGRLTKIDPASAASISGHRRIIALRHVLVHGYAKVDDRVIWAILQHNLPVLRQEVSSMLAKAGDPASD